MRVGGRHTHTYIYKGREREREREYILWGDKRARECVREKRVCVRERSKTREIDVCRGKICVCVCVCVCVWCVCV